jgi:small subunit ribosomal protein S5e
MAVRIVQHAFDIINLLTDENPIQVILPLFLAIAPTFLHLASVPRHSPTRPYQVLATAIQQASPREDSTRIGSGGVARRQVMS